MIDKAKKAMTGVGGPGDEDDEEGGGEGGAGGGDNKQAKIDMLENKIEVLVKNQEIDLRHAKEVAARNADQLLNTKLAECRYAYEEELEVISK